MEPNEIWAKYDKSHDYMQKKGLVSKTNRNWNMYIGNQWDGIDGGADLPSLNFIKPIVKYKVSTIAQHSMTANYADCDARPEYNDIYRFINSKFAQSC